MSVIVYGPQGCGKTLNSELLRRHYGMRTVQQIEGHELARAIETPRGAAAFKTGTVLFIIDGEPPAIAGEMRRVVSFFDAMAEINRKAGAILIPARVNNPSSGTTQEITP